jgi:TRAP-type mannitol/chloroaromatic compound transport system permease small subunit
LRVRAMKTFLLITDGIIEWTGKIISWLVAVMTVVLGYEVLMRYYFNAPTAWAYDVSSMLGGTFWILGAGYTLMKHKHVRIDIIYSRFSRRTQALIDVIFTSVFFFPVWIGILYRMIPYVALSWQTKERSLESFWRPPIYPLKTVMLIGVCLLLLAGTAEFVRTILILRERSR